MTSFAQQITPADDIASIILWQATRAKLLARSGDHQQALPLAKAALALALTTDALNEHARTHLDLAEVLRLDGRTHEAALAVERACGLYEAKGNIAGAAIARTLHAKLIPAER